MKKFFIFSIFVLSLLLIGKTWARENQNESQPETGYASPWSGFVRGGYIHQFDTDLDNSNSSFTADRLFIQPGVGYSPHFSRSFSLAFGFGYDHYNFKGEDGFGALNPWQDIYSVRVSAPVRLNKGKHWSFFMVPTIRATGENDAAVSDSLTGGVFAGFGYKFNDRLTLGPGIGIISQLEDDASIFPVLVINWKITERLSLETGRGLGATLGPGIMLNWKINERMVAAFGGRYEKLRFRLDDQSETPSGIGQDKSFPLFAAITYHFNPLTRISLTGGLETGGELLLEDRDGNVLAEQDYETAPFLGFSFSHRF